ncbi:MAG: lacticin 481 family lantibiotic [Streptococcus salivarius]
MKGYEFFCCTIFYNLSIKEVSLEELDQIIGAGNGVFKTISHECHLNTWAFLATCCS